MTSLKPGRKLDALIAEKVMGGIRHEVESVLSVDVSAASLTLGKGIEYPRYSTDIAAAWEVIEKILADDWAVEIHGSEFFVKGKGGFDVRFACKAGARGRFDASADTFTHAVCLAALMAVA